MGCAVGWLLDGELVGRTGCEVQDGEGWLMGDERKKRRDESGMEGNEDGC